MNDAITTLRSLLQLRNISCDIGGCGEISFAICITPGSFLNIQPEEVFDGALPADLICEQINVRCQVLTPDSTSSLLPADSVAIFSELPIGPINEKDSTVLACVLNEFNADGILAGSLFADTSDNSVYYRQFVCLTGLLSDEGISAALGAMIDRSHSELTYALQGLVIFKRKINEAHAQIKQTNSSKVVALFPTKNQPPK